MLLPTSSLGTSYARLRQIYDDPDFEFTSSEYRRMAKDGPQFHKTPANDLRLIADRQWSVIEKLVTAHDMLLAEKGSAT